MLRPHRGFGGVGGAVWRLCAVWFCQAMALRRRAWASAKASCDGQAEAMAILIRRTLTRTSAPNFSSFNRMVPQVVIGAKPRARGCSMIEGSTDRMAESCHRYGGGYRNKA